MLENHALFLSVFCCIAGVVIASWEIVPQLNEMLQLHPFPNDIFRYKVVLLVLATIGGTFVWDRLCTAVFAPAVFKAMSDEARKTTLKDLFPVVQTAVMVVGGVFLLSSGNILLWGGAYYYYQYVWKKKPAAAAA